jgi:hypothetical protein
VAGDRGTFWPSGAWGYADTGPEYKGALQGWACPVNGAPTADRFSITVTVRIDGAAPSGWAGVFFCAADDQSFDDLDQRQPGLCGYRLLLRQSGSLEVHIVNDGIAQPAAAVATSPIQPGGTATLRANVTPTEVAITRVDAPGAITVADGTYRGGYFHLGRRSAAVRFSDVIISQEDNHAHTRRRRPARLMHRSGTRVDRAGPPTS